MVGVMQCNDTGRLSWGWGVCLAPLDFGEHLSTLAHSVPPLPVGYVFPYVPFRGSRALLLFQHNACPRGGKVKSTVGLKVKRTWCVRIFGWTAYGIFLKFSVRTREHSSDLPLQFPRLKCIIIPNI